MKAKKSWWSVIGLILWESIAFIDLAIDVYTGEITGTELIKFLSLCFILTSIICFIIRRKKYKEKK